MQINHMQKNYLCLKESSMFISINRIHDSICIYLNCTMKTNFPSRVSSLLKIKKEQVTINSQRPSRAPIN